MTTIIYELAYTNLNPQNRLNSSHFVSLPFHPVLHPFSHPEPRHDQHLSDCEVATPHFSLDICSVSVRMPNQAYGPYFQREVSMRNGRGKMSIGKVTVRKVREGSPGHSPASPSTAIVLRNGDGKGPAEKDLAVRPAFERLTFDQQTALEQLVSGMSVTQAAASSDISRATLYRWLKTDPTFRAAYNDWHNQMRKRPIAAAGDDRYGHRCHPTVDDDRRWPTGIRVSEGDGIDPGI